MIKPTIFIGLGTTGIGILKTLRQLMSEEFSKGGLPIFRYVAVETTEIETGDNRNSFEGYEKISVVNATIPDLTPIRTRLDPNHPNYNPDMADWLNPEILNIYQGFRDGVANIRMVGRLCLWENWKEVQHTLTNARSTIIAPNSQARTTDILREHYRAKNLPQPETLIDTNGINSYVFGSLCGGTCSGMFIDMAYLIKSILGSGNANEVNGIFTMYDQTSAESNDAETATRAANCYAGLAELNFYNYTQTLYDVTFPSGIKVEDPQKPYNFEYLVSPSGKSPNIRFVEHDGRTDENGLNTMVALNLFADSVADTDGNKRAIRIDGIAFGDYGTLNPVPAGDIPTMTKCLSSFGLSAVWYPKYRIATAAACLAIQKLLQNWMKGQTYSVTIKTNVTQAWHEIAENVEILSSPLEQGFPSLAEELESILNSETKRFEQITSPDQLRHYMSVIPNIDIDGEQIPLANSFLPSGHFYEWMQAKVDECNKAFCDAIDKLFDKQINNIDLQGTYGIDDVRTFFMELDRTIREVQEKQCPNSLPTLNLDQLDFEPMRKADNIWTKLAGKQKKAVKAQQDSLIEEFRQLFIGRKGICSNLRNYFLREILESVREKLGFTKHADGPTICEKITQIEENLNYCFQEIQEIYRYNIEKPEFTNVKILTNDPQNSIQADAESLCNQIINDITSEGLLFENGNTITLYAFLNKEREDIKHQMIEAYRRSALNRINQDDSLIAKIRELLGTDGGEIRNLAVRSNPYQEFSLAYQPFHIDNLPGPEIILGCVLSDDNNSLMELREILNFGRSGYSTVDHFLFFYQEETGFAFDDLASYEVLKRNLENSPGIYGHWTHQDPSFYDLTFYSKCTKLERWCRILAQIVPTIRENNENTFKDIFEYQDGTLILEYRTKDGVAKRLCLTDDTSGIQEFCRQSNETNYNNFLKSVMDEFNRLEADNVIQQVNHLVGQVTDIEEQDVLSAYFNQILNEVYPNLRNTDAEND